MKVSTKQTHGPRINLLKQPVRKIGYPVIINEKGNFKYFMEAVYPRYVDPMEAQKTFVLYRDSLRMSDIPVLQREFLRIRREALLILQFCDKFDAIASVDKSYCNFSVSDRKFIVESLKRVGMKFSDPHSVRKTLSHILKQLAYRYPDSEYYSLEMLGSLITCELAKCLNEDLDEETLSTLFCQLNDVDSAKHYILLREDETLSSAWVERLSRSMFFLNRHIYETGPVFVSHDRNYPPLLVINARQEYRPSAEFIVSPSGFIEAQENVQEGSEFPNGFCELNCKPYDIHRIKRFTDGKTSIVSKRLDPLRVSSIEEEISNAKRIEGILKSKGIPNCRTVQYLGLVYDRGNFYTLMQDEQAPSLYNEANAEGMEVLKRVKEALSNGEHQDLEERNALWNGKELILLDFEEHANMADIENTAPDSEPLTNAVLSLDEGPVGLGRSAKRLPTIIAIGDIHGNDQRLSQILSSEPVAKAERVVFLGDYFDRDSGTRKVFASLRKRDPKKTVFLLGNHELSFLMSMKGDQVAFEEWIKFGGLTFLAAAMNLDKISAVFKGLGEQIIDFDTIDAIEYLKNTQPAILNEIFYGMRNNAFFKLVKDWLADNGRLFYVDEMRNLYIHAGIRSEERLDWKHFDRLEYLEKEFIRAIKSPEDGSLGQAAGVSAQFSHYLNMREADSIGSFAQKDWRGLRKFLFALGIRSVIYGHSRRSEVSNYKDRFFGIDLGMANYYGGRGGFLEIGRNGVVSYQFPEKDSPLLERRVIVEKNAFREDLKNDEAGLIKSRQEYHLSKVIEVVPY